MLLYPKLFYPDHPTGSEIARVKPHDAANINIDERRYKKGNLNDTPMIHTSSHDMKVRKSNIKKIIQNTRENIKQ